MLYALIFIALAMVAVLLLRLRVRIELENRSRRILFAGLGRTGVDLDFMDRRGTLRLAGIPLRGFDLDRRKARPDESEKKKPKKAKKEARPSRRTRSISDALLIAPAVLSAVGSYLLGLIRDAVVEEADGKIEGGFDQPDLTGISYGYYQAAAAAVPAIGQRFRFVPDWTGPSFSGAARFAVAIPVYRLVWRTLLLAKDLPLRKLVKLAIGKKKGGQDGQQRS